MMTMAVDAVGLTDSMPIYFKMIAALVAVAVYVKGEAEGKMTAASVNSKTSSRFG